MPALPGFAVVGQSQLLGQHRAGSKESIGPDFKREDRIKLAAEIAAACQMFFHAARQFVGIEQAALPDSLRMGVMQKGIAQFPAKPLVDWHSKAAFRADE